MAATTSPENAAYLHMNDNGKVNAKHIDEKGSDQSALSDDDEFTPQEQRKIIHRIDRRLVLTTGIMYCVSLMDRTNLGQASIAGMQRELRLNVGFRYVSLNANTLSSMLICCPSSPSSFWSSSSHMSSFSHLPRSYAERLVPGLFWHLSQLHGESSW